LRWDGTELTGDIWPGLEADIQELRLKAEAAAMKETGITYNVQKDISEAKTSHEVDRPLHLYAL
jgi:hypothetical protein